MNFDFILYQLGPGPPETLFLSLPNTVCFTCRALQVAADRLVCLEN